MPTKKNKLTIFTKNMSILWDTEETEHMKH